MNEDQDFTVAVSEQGGHAVLRVSGEVDIATAPLLQNAVDQLLAQGATNLVIDLERVGFLDSAGLRVLVSAHRSAGDQQGQLRIVCTADRIRHVFEMTSLDGVLSLHDSLDEATRDNGSPPL